MNNSTFECAVNQNKSNCDLCTLFEFGEKLEATFLWVFLEVLGNALLYKLDSWYYNNPYKTIVDHLQCQTLTIIVLSNIVLGTILYLRYVFIQNYSPTRSKAHRWSLVSHIVSVRKTKHILQHFVKAWWVLYFRETV